VIRARLALVALLAASLTAGGLALERGLGVRPAAVGAVSPPDVLSGAWFCPHGGGEAWQVWLVAANPSDRPTELLLTARGATAEVVSATLEPRSHRYIRMDADGLSAGTVVEFFGGPAAVSMVAARPDGGGLAAEPCTPTAAARWYVPDGRSEVEGEAANVVVMNPTASDAVVDIVVTTEREALRPGPLQGLVLAPGAVKGFDLNRFSLGARTVGARVTAAVGRIAVAGIGLSEGGIRADIGVANLSRRWFFPGTGDGARGELVVAAAGEEVPFQVRAQGLEEQLPSLEQESVDAGGIRTFTVATGEGGLVVEAEGSAGFVAARRSSFGGTGIEEPDEEVSAEESPAPTESPSPEPSPSPDGTPSPSPTPGESRDQEEGSSRDRRDRPEPDETVDRAGTTGSPVVSGGWVVPPATGPEGGPAALVLQNPGPRSVRARVLLVGATGPVEASGLEALEDIPVPAGTVAVIDLEPLVSEPVTALVEATDGGLVAAQVSLAPEAYAVSLGSPASSVLTGFGPGI
jgi:hypothetical protein